MCRPAFNSLIFFLLLSALSCNAPRDNPFDPANPNGSTSYIDGAVLSESRTPVPLTGVTVEWLPTGTSVISDKNGKFSLSLIHPSNGWLVSQKNGYVADSLLIQWNSTREISVVRNLHALPVMDSCSVWSVVKNNYSGVEYGLAAFVSVRDEYDFDSVFLANSGLGIKKALEKITSISFQGSFADYELPISSFNDIIGAQFSIIIKEQAGASYNVGSTSVARIIDQEIETISPKNQDTIPTASPTLRWQRFLPGFRFSYRIEVYTNEPDPKLQWSKSSFSSDSINVVVNPPLTVSTASNSFYWVIWCMDGFNNRSRSKPASFVCNPSGGE